MYAIRWKEKSWCVWSGQGYSEAPWQAKTYQSREEAQAVASRISGVVVPWENQNQRGS